MKKILSVFLALCAIAVCLAGCAGKEAPAATAGNDKPGTGETALEPVEGATNYVCIEVKDFGAIIVELYPEIAPITVNNFQKLVKAGFYNGLTFHRVISGFMIQGGDPAGNGTGGPGYQIKGEFTANGVKNDLKHTRGVISMARSMAPDSAGSQFFIMHDDAPHLDGSYAAFGKVVEGIETVDEIAAADTDFSDRPLRDARMKKVTFAEEA